MNLEAWTTRRVVRNVRGLHSLGWHFKRFGFWAALVLGCSLLAFVPSAHAQDSPAQKDPALAAIPWKALPVPEGSAATHWKVWWDGTDLAHDAEEAPRLLGRLIPWLEAQRAAIQAAQYLPEDLRTKLAGQVVPIFVLRSRVSYERWQVLHPNRDYRNRAVTYSPALGALVCHIESKGIGESSHDLRNYLLRKHAEQLFAQAAPQWTQAGPQWLLNGVCDVLSCSGQSKPPKVIQPYLYRQGYRNLVRILNDYSDRKLYWLSSEVMFGVHGAHKLQMLPIDLKAAGHAKQTAWGLLYYFDQQAMLRVHAILEQGAGAQDPLGKLCALAVDGPLPIAKVLTILGFENSQQADRALLKWVTENAKKTTGIEVLGHSAPVANGKPKPSTEGSAASEAAPAETAPVLPTLEPLQATERVALALVHAQAGDFASALSALGAEPAFPIEPPDADQQNWLEREATRLQQVTQVRDQLLTTAVSKRQKLRWNFEGKMVMVKPAQWEGGKLALTPSRSCPTEALMAQELGAQFLLDNWKWVDAAETPALRGYLEDLVGEADAKAFEADSNLLQDRKDTPRAIGPLLAFLTAPTGGEAWAAELASLSEQARTLSEASRHLPYFRHRLQAQLQRQADQKGPADFLHAKVQPLTENRVRISYGFENPNELQDFRVDKELWKAERPLIPSQPTEVDQADPELQNGTLRLRGRHGFRLPLEFEGPIEVRYNVQLEEAESDMLWFYIYVGLHYLDDETWIRSNFDEFVMSSKVGQKLKTETPEVRDIQFSKLYAVILAWNGEQATMEFGDNDPLTIPVQGKLSGAVTLWCQSFLNIHISDLVIEGQVTEASLAAQRDLWVQTRLAELGFPAGEGTGPAEK